MFFPDKVYITNDNCYALFKQWYDGFLPSFDLRNLKEINIGKCNTISPHMIPSPGYIMLDVFKTSTVFVHTYASPEFGWIPSSVKTLNISGMPIKQKNLQILKNSTDRVYTMYILYKENITPLVISQFIVNLSLDNCFFQEINFSSAKSLQYLWLGHEFRGSISKFPPNLLGLGILNYNPYSYNKEDDDIHINYTSMVAPQGTRILYIGSMAPVIVTKWTSSLKKVTLPHLHIVRHEDVDGTMLVRKMVHAPFPDGFKAQINYI
jgi:hypothetical protein